MASYFSIWFFFSKAYLSDDIDSLMTLLGQPELKSLATRAFNMWRHWKSGYRFMKKDMEGVERNLKKVFPKIIEF